MINVVVNMIELLFEFNKYCRKLQHENAGADL